MNNETYWISNLNLQEEMPIKLWQTYSDADLQSLSTPGPAGIHPGMVKFVNAHMAKYTGELKNIVLLFGPAIVQLVCNRQGSTLTQGMVPQWYSNNNITATGGSTTTIVCAAATFVANEQVGNYVYCLDNADSAGAAPEGQIRQIIKNTTTTLTVQPAFTTAVAASDTFRIFSSGQVIIPGADQARNDIAGAVLAPDGIADNYWGWVCRWGRCGVRIEASTAIAGAKTLMTGGNGGVYEKGAATHGIGVGVSLWAMSADSVSDIAVADIDCWSILCNA